MRRNREVSQHSTSKYLKTALISSLNTKWDLSFATYTIETMKELGMKLRSEGKEFMEEILGFFISCLLIICSLYSLVLTDLVSYDRGASNSTNWCTKKYELQGLKKISHKFSNFFLGDLVAELGANQGILRKKTVTATESN